MSHSSLAYNRGFCATLILHHYLQFCNTTVSEKSSLPKSLFSISKPSTEVIYIALLRTSFVINPAVECILRASSPNPSKKQSFIVTEPPTPKRRIPSIFDAIKRLLPFGHSTRYLTRRKFSHRGKATNINPAAE